MRPHDTRQVLTQHSFNVYNHLCGYTCGYNLTEVVISVVIILQKSTSALELIQNIKNVFK